MSERPRDERSLVRLAFCAIIVACDIPPLATKYNVQFVAVNVEAFRFAKISQVLFNLSSPQSDVSKKGLPSFLPYFGFRRPGATNKQLGMDIESR